MTIFDYTDPKIIQITFSFVPACQNLYQHARNQFIPSVNFRDRNNFLTLEKIGHIHF